MTGKKKKCIAAIICILFVFVTFASLFYIVKEAGHECTGEKCPICACVHQAHPDIEKSRDRNDYLVGYNFYNIIYTMCFYAVCVHDS